MKDIKPRCDHCSKFSEVRIKQEEGDTLHLCKKHEKLLKDYMRSKYKKVSDGS